MGDECTRVRHEAGAGEVVNKPDDDERKAPRVAAPLWPSAADGRSGMRGKDERDEPYRLLEPLGATAYGDAFRAQHVGSGREVALHYLPSKDDLEGSLAAELPVAIAKCAQLSQPHVIAIESYGRDAASSLYYVVTEPLRGVSLATLLEEQGTLPLARALTIALQLGGALRAAHKLGIVHGALTPANVRIEAGEAGEKGEAVRVVGFGATLINPSLLRDRALLGEAEDYDAPELARGAAPSARSDVYALASLLFHMLSGIAPRGKEEAPRLAQSSVEPAPRALDELLAECLDPRPEQRTQDVVSMLRKLREIARAVGAAEGTLPAASDANTGPVELPPADGDSSGSLLGVDAHGARQGALWILTGLVLALAAVWLLWQATRSR